MLSKSSWILALLAMQFVLTVQSQDLDQEHPYPPISQEEKSNSKLTEPVPLDVRAHLLIDVDPTLEDPRTWIASAGERWPNKQLPYRLVHPFNNSERNEIANAMNTIEEETCIKIVPYDRSRHASVINIGKKNPNSCHVSFVGYKRNRNPDMNLGWCSMHRQSILHEFFHLIGTEHEMNRPDRDRYLRVNWNNIPTWLWSQFARSCSTNKPSSTPTCVYGNTNAAHWRSCCTLPARKIGNFPYDRKSIMHYSKAQGSKGRGLPSMTLLSDSSLDFGGPELTETDIAEANYFYECSPRPDSDPVPPNSKLVVLEKVNCVGRYCDCRRFESPDFPARHQGGSYKWKFAISQEKSCYGLEVRIKEMKIKSSGRVRQCRPNYLIFTNKHGDLRETEFCGYMNSKSKFMHFNDLDVEYYVEATSVDGFRAEICLVC